MAIRKPESPSPNTIRTWTLEYFYHRNSNATSSRGRKGSGVKISDVKRELKLSHNLTQAEVQGNLTYLKSQGWIEEETTQKQVVAKGGTLIPSTTSFFRITADGIDKIEGPGEFTMPRFRGINIQATGQNVITLGDGNLVDAQFTDLGRTLFQLRDAITESEASEATKLEHVADIETIQAQLAKSEPNHAIISLSWESIKRAAALNGCGTLVARVAELIQGFLP